MTMHPDTIRFPTGAMRSGESLDSEARLIPRERVELASSRTATVSERSIRLAVAAGVKRKVRPLDNARTVIERARRGSTLAGMKLALAPSWPSASR